MTKHIQLRLTGVVQGVGFRPFVYRQALELGLAGSVQNTSEGLLIDVEGSERNLTLFQNRLQSDRPAQARVETTVETLQPVKGLLGFTIVESAASSVPTVKIPVDTALCEPCRHDIQDPANRRYRYPFTTCSHCGPRFSIIQSMPYDRSNTTMADFPLCDPCQKEFDHPMDRRFHAQSNACWTCGPQLEYHASSDLPLQREDALATAVAALRRGQILAVKGLGGFHLLVKADHSAAVARLRERKHREAKPFAVMAPSLLAVKEACRLNRLEENLLTSAHAPIVLLHQKNKAGENTWAEAVAPGLSTLGVMLPYTPLHALLLHELNTWVVATSGNLSDEPICIDNEEAKARLSGIADGFLFHNRRILRPLDDSIVRVVYNKLMVMRSGRGQSPLERTSPDPIPSILAVGGHLKNTLAAGNRHHIAMGQHIGDLNSPLSFETFQKNISDLTRFYHITPRHIACDSHPDYQSTQYAREQSLPVISIQHHHAHVAAGMAEHHLKGPVLGVAWDGSGDGEDGTVWGGEFFMSRLCHSERLGSLRPFPLPGGDKAAREPWRAALGLCYEWMGESLFEEELFDWMFKPVRHHKKILQNMLTRTINCPPTTSMGRLFDAVGFFLTGRIHNQYEGQTAMMLEAQAEDAVTDQRYSLPIREQASGFLLLDWQPLLIELLEDRANGFPLPLMAMKFHLALAHSISAVADKVRYREVVLSGGCFQNKILLEAGAQALSRGPYTAVWPERIPLNDGGLSLGQLAAAAERLKRSCPACASPSPAV